LETIEEVMHDDIAGIGLGVAGLIDRKNGRVFSSPIIALLKGWILLKACSGNSISPYTLKTTPMSRRSVKRSAGQVKTSKTLFY